MPTVVRRARRWLGFHLARIPEGVVTRTTALRPVEIDGQRLDARTQHAVALVQRSGPPLHLLAVAEARREYMEFPRIFAGPPLELPRVNDRLIPGEDGPMRVRIYEPPGPGRARPGLIYLHGGGGVIGTIETHDVACRRLCRSLSMVVISVDYRLAPEHPFPAGLYDATAAFRWAMAHAESLEVDPRRLAIGGDSLGGNLAAGVCQRLAAAGEARPRAQLLIYPATDVAHAARSHQLFAEGFLLSEAMIDWFMGHYLGGADPHDPRVSPLLSETLSGLPPAVVVTAGFDPLRDEGRAYADALREAGVPVSYRCHPGLVHGFAQMTGVVGLARRALDDAAARLWAFMGEA